MGKPCGASTSSNAAGFVLVDSLFKPKFMSAEAVAILTYPNAQQNERAIEKYLSGKIKSLFSKQRGASEPAFVKRVQSGRRSYHCWTFPVAPLCRDAGQFMTAILFERNAQPQDLRRVA